MTRRCTLCGAPAESRGAKDGHLGPGPSLRPLCDQCADDRPLELLVPLDEQDHAEAGLFARLQALLDHQEAPP